MHLARLLCQLLLHWEFIPFLPVNSSRPQGLADFVDTEPQKCHAPAGFWRSSARECFGAAQMILSLSSAWTATNALPLTPFVGYAVHIAAFIDSHGVSFPWMCSHALNTLHYEQDADEEDIVYCDTKSNLKETLCASGFDELKGFVRLVDKWSETLFSVTEYFDGFKADFSAAKRCASSEAEAQPEISLRNGGRGIGTVKYSLFEKDLRDFGVLDVGS